MFIFLLTNFRFILQDVNFNIDLYFEVNFLFDLKKKNKFMFKCLEEIYHSDPVKKILLQILAISGPNNMFLQEPIKWLSKEIIFDICVFSNT